MKSTAIGRIDFDDPQVTPDAVWDWMAGTFAGRGNLLIARNDFRVVNTDSLREGALLEWTGNHGSKNSARLAEWRPAARVLAIRCPADDPQYHHLNRFQVNYYMNGNTFVIAHLEIVEKRWKSGLNWYLTLCHLLFEGPTDPVKLLDIQLNQLGSEWSYKLGSNRVTPAELA